MDAKSKTRAVWGATPAGAIFAKHLTPGTKEFFEETARVRNGYEMRFLFELIPFASFRDKKVLELGCGVGYDALEFLRNGAHYTGIDITPQNIRRCVEHSAFYGYSANVMEGDAEHLSFPDQFFDVVFSNGVLHHTPDILESFRETVRVLKHGGEFWAIVYHKNSVFYWLTLFLFDHLLRFGFLKRTFQDRLSMIEYTTSEERPLVKVYSQSELRKLLTAAGLRVEEIWVRRLIKEELPGIPVLKRLWELIPQQWLDALGRFAGWYVIAKAVKV